MSENRKTLIHYESPGTNGASADVRITGTGETLIRAFVRIAIHLEDHLHFSAERLSMVLPALMALEKAGTTIVSTDMEAIRKAKEGG